MKVTSRNKGFSLTEVLMAIGTLAVGMLFIGGTMAVAVHLSFASNDQVMGSLVARDALAKMQLYGVDYSRLPDTYDTEEYTTYANELMLTQITEEQFNDLFIYPVYHGTLDIIEKRYYERILCKRSPSSDRLIDVALFVVRDPNVALERIEVSAVEGDNTQLQYIWNPGETASPFIYGSYIVGEADNRTYRVYRNPSAGAHIIQLSEPWKGGDAAWAVLPGRAGPNPLIEVRTTQIPHY